MRREVLKLSAAALPVLAAEPLYLLVDTAVVGRLGGTDLAALGVGAVVLGQLSVLFTFLSYGTTARAARLFGAGKRDEAVAEGVQATWLALGGGALLVLIGQFAAGPVARALAGDELLAEEAASWIRIALFGVPLVMVTLAGNGWMRGVQDTRSPLKFVLVGNGVSAALCPVLVHATHLGLHGSALANVTGQLVSAGLFLRALTKEGAGLRPRPAAMLGHLGVARDLVLRSLAFQICFLSAMAVAARYSVASAGAHQVAMQLWSFQSLVLDSLAIAAQSLVGATLGAGDGKRAKEMASALLRYGLVCGLVFAAVYALVSGPLPHVFTVDEGVIAEIPKAYWVFVALQPIAGVVFALDGVLLGAGDIAYLRTTTVFGALGGFLPLIWISHLMHWGLVGIWIGLAAFMVVRLVALTTRVHSGKWIVVGERL